MSVFSFGSLTTNRMEAEDKHLKNGPSKCMCSLTLLAAWILSGKKAAFAWLRT